MIDRGGKTQRFAAVLAGATLVLAVGACTGASPSATASARIVSAIAVGLWWSAAAGFATATDVTVGAEEVQLEVELAPLSP